MVREEGEAGGFDGAVRAAASGSGRRLGGNALRSGGVCTNWTNQNDECSSDWISVEMDDERVPPASTTEQHRPRVSFAQWRDVEVSSYQ